MSKSIKVIDLFAGPGGLAEGFSSIIKNNKRRFSIGLSIEKDESAHKTLLLRSFCRQFQKNNLPTEYYNAISTDNIEDREKNIEELFKSYPVEFQIASEEAIKFELGKDSEKFLDSKIKSIIGNDDKWVLIGGPPCQAYSMAGRSRVGGISSDDHRVYLYKEYLKVIAKHSPSIFVMENVKGLISAKVDGNSVFEMILEDLSAPHKIINGTKINNYKIYSLVEENVKQPKEYIINSEDYGVPQKRHRVILLGIREDIEAKPSILKRNVSKINIEDVIDDLPKIRSGLNRSFDRYEFNEKGKRVRKYKKVEDSKDNWQVLMNDNLNQLIKLNGFNEDEDDFEINESDYGTGSEYLKYKRKEKKKITHQFWYMDDKLNGVLNHQSRSHLTEDLKRYMFSTMFTDKYKKFPRMRDFKEYGDKLLPDHISAESGNFADRFRVQKKGVPATTITSHISKDGHYFIHYDKSQVRSLTVREAARIQTFPDNYLFRGSRTMQFHQVGNAVPPYLAYQIGKIVLKILDV
ncbi:DNA cytosine methyltransferase [Aequorivita capsosiphonis]|uniref:DNA cytosine methyltransferase n=1 Tax=Aequorivita capsosiphonis TaxID=487317 RepID=UPI0003FD44C1|nr:DNA cytosine methyltransferase [Aequorivita capsosiphonis]